MGTSNGMGTCTNRGAIDASPRTLPPKPRPTRVLIVDDEAVAREQLAEVLEAPGRLIECADGGEAACARLAATAASGERFDVVMTDLVMPGRDGFAVLDVALAANAATRVIVVTGRGTLESAVAAMRAGAWHFVTKPYELAEIRSIVTGAERAAAIQARAQGPAETRRPPIASESSGHTPADAATLERGTGRERRRDTQGLDDGRAGDRLAKGAGHAPRSWDRGGDDAGPLAEWAQSQNAAVRALATTAQAVARSDAPVVVFGETGVGKERLVRALHAVSPRAAGPFLAVNCGAMPDDLLDALLFGHVRGAFTGAQEAKTGLIEAADGGTLFLDEFAEMSPAMQVRLLRVLETREVTPVGATRPVPVDFRLVVASHRRLEHEVARGRLRMDLFYRVNVVTLVIPPLRERLDDLPMLIDSIVSERDAARAPRAGRRSALETAPVRFDAGALACLRAHPWPGNVRELANVIERARLLSPGDGPITADAIVFDERIPAPPADHDPADPARVAGHPAAVQTSTGPTPTERAAPDAQPRGAGKGATPGGETSCGDATPSPGDSPNLKALEREAILDALARTGGHRRRAAELLGIDRVSLWRKLKRHGLS